MASTPNERILALARKRGALSTSEVARALGISRQAAHRRLRELADGGHLAHAGAGRSARWVVSPGDLRFAYRIAGLAEDRVWDDLSRQVAMLRDLDGEARAIAHYAMTEMLNNAIDHSQSKRVSVAIGRKAQELWVEIRDRGIGVFENVRSRFELATPMEAVAELSKGKVTTQPERHTGEGVFFTSKAVSRFELESNGVEWIVDNAIHDFTVRVVPRVPGTRVRCVISMKPSRSLQSIFEEYTDDFEFTRTRTTIRLFAIGSEFVSRSHARRLLHGLDKFREVVLDFERIESIGQGFADEVFRVWARDHQNTSLVVENAGAAVEFMIRRARPTP